MAVGGHGSHENVEETDDEPVKEQPAKKSKAKSTKKGTKKAPAKEPKNADSSGAEVVPRIKWAKLLNEVACDDGTTKTNYPFLERKHYYLDALAVSHPSRT